MAGIPSVPATFAHGVSSGFITSGIRPVADTRACRAARSTSALLLVVRLGHDRWIGKHLYEHVRISSGECPGKIRQFTLALAR